MVLRFSRHRLSRVIALAFFLLVVSFRLSAQTQTISAIQFGNALADGLTATAKLYPRREITFSESYENGKVSRTATVTSDYYLRDKFHITMEIRKVSEISRDEFIHIVMY